VVFLSLSRPGWYLKLGHDRFFPHPLRHAVIILSFNANPLKLKREREMGRIDEE
jgi:hypothetical protein